MGVGESAVLVLQEFNMYPIGTSSLAPLELE